MLRGVYEIEATYLLLIISMLWHRQAIFVRSQVVFLCWMQDSNLEVWRHLYASRLNAHSQTDWAIEEKCCTGTEKCRTGCQTTTYHVIAMLKSSDVCCRCAIVLWLHFAFSVGDPRAKVPSIVNKNKTVPFSLPKTFKLGHTSFLGIVVVVRLF